MTKNNATEIDRLVAHLSGYGWAVVKETRNHPRLIGLSNRRDAAYSAEIVELDLWVNENGRILTCKHRMPVRVLTDLNRIFVEFFGPDWKPLEALCGGQAPTIGRTVHVWRCSERPHDGVKWPCYPAVITETPSYLHEQMDAGWIGVLILGATPVHAFYGPPADGTEADKIVNREFALRYFERYGSVPRWVWTWPEIIR